MASINRRDFVAFAGGLAVAAEAAPTRKTRTAVRGEAFTLAVPDEGWRLLVDQNASWRDDDIHLPEDVDLASLPVNPPSGGWAALAADAGMEVTLPSTVEQHYWGKFGTRSYDKDEFTYAASDPVPQNGAYRGVSWWWCDIEIPAAFGGRRLILAIRGARLRAEVFLNEKLVGYSILEELPFECDVTAAAVPGGKNTLAIRITNPGGRYDWVDGDTIEWGKVKLHRSHGFGGLDRAIALRAEPKDGRIADFWVLNTPEPHTVHAFVEHDGVKGELTLDLVEEKSGRRVPAQVRKAASKDGTRKFVVTAKSVHLWSLDNPTLYRLRARLTTPSGAESVREVTFGFRWFGPDGLGKNAMFRLNGKRIRLYSAISWGYWGLNGLWPTPELAEKEVMQAKTLGLNALSFHRNVGKTDVLAAQDRLGLLRHMEPGGGKLAIGKLPKDTNVSAPDLVMTPAKDPADKFSESYMIAKCKAMLRAFRSHPSLIQYTLQNEIGADLNNPATIAILAAMREEDESRSIVLNDGFVSLPRKAAQAWYAPYDPKIHRSDEEEWGDWWDDHQGAGDQWYDDFYKDPEHFNYRQPLATTIVEFGEMEGCAVPDNHVLAMAEIAQRGGTSYDLEDRRQIVAAYGKFLDRWGFRKAFPTTESLFLAIGRKSYDSWQQYMENARINDATDFAVISGWESTAIDNHSGLVDNLRNFKSDPALIRSSLLSVRPVAKQCKLVVGLGEGAVFDLYLLNDTGAPISGTLVFTMRDPAGKESELGRFPVPAMAPDQFSVLIKEAFATPVLAQEGRYSFSFALTGMPSATQTRDILAVDAKAAPLAGRTLHVAVVGVWDRLREQLAAIPGVSVADYIAGRKFDAIIASGLTDQSTPAQKLGGDAGIDLAKTAGTEPVPGALPQGVIDAVKTGTPLLAMPQEDGLADGVATQLSALGAFAYFGQVGKLRAPWMGNWYFLREHPVYAGLPVDQAMGIYHQAHGRQANGLLVDGPGVDVFVGYGRDHDRGVGAGTFTAKLGNGKILFQRVPDLDGGMQLRFLRNALAWLCG